MRLITETVLLVLVIIPVSIALQALGEPLWARCLAGVAIGYFWRRICDTALLLRLRLRARSNGWGSGACPLCGEWFSCEQLQHLQWPRCLMRSPEGGPLVCLQCQDAAVELNTTRYGFSL